MLNKTKTSRYGTLLCGILAAAGSYLALARGGNDFGVFYAAWTHALTGHGHLIYSQSPDRFLYAPGFAWFLSPLAALPWKSALILWCFGKFLCLLAIFRILALTFGPISTCLGVLLLSRPLLIDFQYGQVNLLLLAAAVWALAPRRAVKTGRVYFQWIVFAIASICKLYPLPLLAVPWIIKTPVELRKTQKRAILIGGGLILVLPFLFISPSEAFHLYEQWQEALIQRGMPAESHNQSFTAFLYHFLSGLPTHVLFYGPKPVALGSKILSTQGLHWIGSGWVCLMMSLQLGWLLKGKSISYPKWICLAIAWTIVPLHLAWKPYFLMGIPMATSLFHDLESDRKSHTALYGFLAVLFCAINLTSFDIIGVKAAAIVESAGVFLFSHLILLGLATTFAWSKDPANHTNQEPAYEKNSNQSLA